MAFDSAGRLWVATADYSDAGQDTVYVVSTPGDAPITVLTGLHTPLGLLWSGDTLYVSSKERVDAYTGFDGEAFASQRTVVTFPAGVGEVNGLARRPDGRLGSASPRHATTACRARSSPAPSCRSCRTGPTCASTPVHPCADRARRTSPAPAHLYVTMNQRDDLGDQTPGDWLSIVEPGQSWGFPDCYGQGGGACAGKPGPVAVLDPHAAVSGDRHRHGPARHRHGHLGPGGGMGRRGRCSGSASAPTATADAVRRPSTYLTGPPEPVRTRHRTDRPSTRVTGRPGPSTGSSQ